MATTAIVAAGQERAFEDLLYVFRAADATAPDRARPLAKLGIEPSSMMAGLEQAGVIKPGDDPKSRYLDERALHEYTRRRQGTAIKILIVASGALFLALGMGIFFLSR
jgi:hypothetical protein